MAAKLVQALLASSTALVLLVSCAKNRSDDRDSQGSQQKSDDEPFHGKSVKEILSSKYSHAELGCELRGLQSSTSTSWDILQANSQSENPNGELHLKLAAETMNFETIIHAEVTEIMQKAEVVASDGTHHKLEYSPRLNLNYSYILEGKTKKGWELIGDGTGITAIYENLPETVFKTTRSIQASAASEFSLACSLVTRER